MCTARFLPGVWALLGVDALTFKSCSFRLRNCQLGRTTNHTSSARNISPPRISLTKCAAKLENGGQARIHQRRRSGEPTLHSARRHHPGHQGHDGRSSGGVHQRLPAVDAGSPRDLAAADVGDPRWTERRRRVARQGEPPPAASLISIASSSKGDRLRGAFNGQISLEVMLLGGISDDDASVDAIARLAGTHPARQGADQQRMPPSGGNLCPAHPRRPAAGNPENISLGCPARSRSSRTSDDMAHTAFRTQIT